MRIVPSPKKKEIDSKLILGNALQIHNDFPLNCAFKQFRCIKTIFAILFAEHHPSNFECRISVGFHIQVILIDLSDWIVCVSPSFSFGSRCHLCSKCASRTSFSHVEMHARNCVTCKVNAENLRRIMNEWLSDSLQVCERMADCIASHRMQHLTPQTSGVFSSLIRLCVLCVWLTFDWHHHNCAKDLCTLE